MGNKFLMNKRSINALSALIIIILLGSIVLPAVLFIISLFVTSYTYSDSQTTDALKSTVPVELTIRPSNDELMNPTHTLTFDNQETYAMAMYDVLVMLPKGIAIKGFGWLIVVNVLIFVCFTLLMIDFIKFIININRGIIFERKNLRYLSRFGWLLILIGVLECILDFFHDLYLQSLNLSLKGYTISYDWNFPWDIFLLGCLALLLTSVWKSGMAIEEERKLTI